jgi:hypothetical protein
MRQTFCYYQSVVFRKAGVLAGQLPIMCHPRPCGRALFYNRLFLLSFAPPLILVLSRNESYTSLFKGAALQFVPCQRIPYKVVDRSCGRAGPVALLWQVQCLHKRGI